jgi:hypothetical protein
MLIGHINKHTPAQLLNGGATNNMVWDAI